MADRTSVQKNHNIFRKNTIFNEHPVYYHSLFIIMALQTMQEGRTDLGEEDVCIWVWMWGEVEEVVKEMLQHLKRRSLPIDLHKWLLWRESCKHLLLNIKDSCNKDHFLNVITGLFFKMQIISIPFLSHVRHRDIEKSS